MKREIVRQTKEWWLWHFQDVLASVFVIAFLAVIVYAIDHSVRETKRYEKICEKQTVAYSLNDGTFKYVEIDGHEYLIWYNGYRGGMTHSPRCRCIQKDTPHEQRAD